MKIVDLTMALLAAAEKGANIARIIRSEKTLLELLVEEKVGSQKNERFVQDFKTLADVLVQEIVRHDLSKEFPGLGDHIYGEESNTFTNALGEKVCIEVMQEKEATKQLLCKILDNNTRAANILSDVIHTTVKVKTISNLQNVNEEISVDDVGIWIDPIDSTAQYIQGDVGIPSDEGLVVEGLQCVVVLVGVFSRKTGQPIIGVVNQPFSQYDPQTETWTGNTVWGVSYNGVNVNSLSRSHHQTSEIKVITSVSEAESVQMALRSKFKLCYASGAGYKILCAITGHVNAYVLSKGSTYKWDTCAPHAILRSLNGGICDFNKAMKRSHNVPESCVDTEITYNMLSDNMTDFKTNSCNSGGIIAYSDPDTLGSFVDAVKDLFAP